MTARNQFLGQWYDLPCPDNKPIANSLAINQQDVAQLFYEDLCVIDSGSSSEGLGRQALAYVTIIDEIVNSHEYDCSSFLPAITALKACICAGWKPLALAEVDIFFCAMFSRIEILWLIYL